MRESIHDIRCDFLCLQDNQSERTRLCRAFRIIYACAQLIYRSFQGSFKRNINVIQDIDVPLSQHSLSRAIDQASIADLLATAAHPRSKALALSTSILHAGDWLNVVPLGISWTANFGYVFSICWAYRRLKSTQGALPTIPPLPGLSRYSSSDPGIPSLSMYENPVFTLARAGA